MAITEKNLTARAEEIQIAKWAEADTDGNLSVFGGVLPYKMCNSDGTGLPLLKYKDFGADIIRFAAGEGVMNHTHEGDHILIVIKGVGFVEYNGVDHDLEPGTCYLIPGYVDHAIKATTDLVLIAVGNSHRPLDSEERMTPLFNLGAGRRQ